MIASCFSFGSDLLVVRWMGVLPRREGASHEIREAMDTNLRAIPSFSGEAEERF